MRSSITFKSFLATGWRCWLVGQGGFSRDQVLYGLYDDQRVVTNLAVGSHVKNLRRKLADMRADEDMIRSVYRVGYRLDLCAGPS